MLQIKNFDTDQAIYLKLQNSRLYWSTSFCYWLAVKLTLDFFFHKKLVAVN